ncbi:MAG TPA: homoserine O-acetyltransferase [Gammaproteobacteria bacterium]|nr:homoserine O-acetyltransferase [Gammaproteobacteria bacterium]
MNKFRLSQGLPLESGQTLEGVEIAYRTWGRLNGARDNAVLICHALTGSADADEWWAGLFGAGRVFDPARDFIVCSNVLGGCYGSTGPASAMPGALRTWGPEFPPVTVRDMVHAQAALLDALGVERLKLVVGGSLGGMQVLEWAALYPERVEAIAPIATTARHSAWAIGLNEAQRQAIRADINWMQGYYPPGVQPHFGLAAARAFAMCSYRGWTSFESRFGRERRASGRYQVESWLNYHGGKLAKRFDANSYITLTQAMDSHDLGRGRGSVEAALAAIEQPALVVTIDSDVLYPPAEQALLARHLPHARLAPLPSPHGHDAFLIDTDALNELLVDFCGESGKLALPAAIPAPAPLLGQQSCGF